MYENEDNPKLLYNPEKALNHLKLAGFEKKNKEGVLINEAGQTLSFNINAQKGHTYMVTPVQEMLKEYGIDMQIKFIDSNANWKNLMERNFVVYPQSWGGLVFPNPETSLHSSLADQNDNNNITGFKNDRVDELLDLYDVEFIRMRGTSRKVVKKLKGVYADQLGTMFKKHTGMNVRL